MARTRRYKKLEKNVVSRMAGGIGGLFKKIGRGLLSFFHIFDQKLTLMVVPHSNGKVVNVQTNVFAVIMGFVIVLGVMVSFIPFTRHSASTGAEISRLREENRETLASLDELRDENNSLLQTAKRFQDSLSQSLSLLGITQSETVTRSTNSNSDLASLFNTKEIASGTLRETADIKQLTSYLENAVQPVEQIGKMLESQGELFTDIPNIWPVKNGIGHISMAFGQNIHPLTGRWYIHRGIDFSTYRSGDSVVATANGQVVTVGFDDSFGNYIIIKHKHGIYTRYAHLNTVRVQKGDQVSQRQTIGTIGNTGISTGPHLHYEIHIGSDVVDPAKYINIK
ncbi:MAG TPA: peptidase M23 [Treponema sp.]|nr:peptidase M23 [Treponema sp.]